MTALDQPDFSSKSLTKTSKSFSTEKSYCDWIARLIKFHKFQSKDALYKDQNTCAEQFLTPLAVNNNVAPSTQNQALNALAFFFSKVLNLSLEGTSPSRSRKEPRMPVVLTKEEVSLL